MKVLSNPIVIREFVIPTRCFLAPINTGYAKKGNPTRSLINFHNSRSGKGIGIAFVGTTGISRNTVPNNNTLVLDSKSNLISFRELSECIKKNGSLPGIQLGCRLTKMSPLKSWQNLSLSKSIKYISNELLSYSKETFNNISESFYESMSLAVKAGYEVIQLHAANGYFLSLLLSPIFNKREDEFGYPRCKIIFDIIEKSKKYFPNIILSLRLNCIYGLQKKSKEIKETIQIATRLFEAGVDIIDFSAGVYDFNKYLIYPSISDGHACYLPYVLKIRKAIGNNLGLISFAGNIWNLDKIDKALDKNMAASIGRSLIADPYFVLKYFKNIEDKIIACTRDQSCPCHYFSNDKNYIECIVNKNLTKKI